MVGYEGMTGLCIVLGDDRSANETVVQSAGSAMRLSTEALRELMKASRSLTTTLLRYVNVFMVQGSQTALANGRGRLDERLARWLLMWHDRVLADELIITHEFLALLLGVRRQGVTVALHELEGKGLIRSTRSHVRVLDRDGLQKAANGFYGIPEAEYDRAIGSFTGAGARTTHARAESAPSAGILQRRRRDLVRRTAGGGRARDLAEAVAAGRRQLELAGMLAHQAKLQELRHVARRQHRPRRHVGGDAAQGARFVGTE